MHHDTTVMADVGLRRSKLRKLCIFILFTALYVFQSRPVVHSISYIKLLNLNSCTVFHRRKLASNRPSRPACCWTKHGYICLCLPCKFHIDITISIDIESNPGPKPEIRKLYQDEESSSNLTSKSSILCLQTDEIGYVNYWNQEESRTFYQ